MDSTPTLLVNHVQCNHKFSGTHLLTWPAQLPVRQFRTKSTLWANKKPRYIDSDTGQIYQDISSWSPLNCTQSVRKQTQPLGLVGTLVPPISHPQNPLDCTWTVCNICSWCFLPDCNILLFSFFALLCSTPLDTKISKLWTMTNIILPTGWKGARLLLGD